MKKTVNFKMPGVMELDVKELKKVDGGNIGSVLKTFGRKITPIAIGIWIAENWDDVKSGAVDGWNENH